MSSIYLIFTSHNNKTTSKYVVLVLCSGSARFISRYFVYHYDFKLSVNLVGMSGIWQSFPAIFPPMRENKAFLLHQKSQNLSRQEVQFLRFLRKYAWNEVESTYKKVKICHVTCFQWFWGEWVSYKNTENTTFRHDRRRFLADEQNHRTHNIKRWYSICNVIFVKTSLFFYPTVLQQLLEVFFTLEHWFPRLLFLIKH